MESIRPQAEYYSEGYKRDNPSHFETSLLGTRSFSEIRFHYVGASGKVENWHFSMAQALNVEF